MKLPNALLSYEADGTSYQHKLWVMEYAQPLALSGSTAQSRTKKHFYPRSHMPGDVEVSGRCESQKNYQELAYFIRRHQRHILNTPRNERFARVDINAAGYRRLMRLWIPSEDFLVRGFINQFSISKRGVFDPAPQYNFKFFVVFDSQAVDITVSSRVRKYYDDSDLTSKKGVFEDPDPATSLDALSVDPVGASHRSRAE